jgi:hypothetical protein
MVVNTCNPSTQDAESEGSWAQSQPALHTVFETSLGCKKILKSCPFCHSELGKNHWKRGIRLKRQFV